MLHQFGAKVLATKRNAMQPEDEDYIVEGMGDPHGDYVHRLYPAQALRSMLKECDFVVVAAPLTPETLGIVNADALHACKPSAYLVDVSRGGVVDHEALTAVLKAGKLAGAALDVFPEEPLPAESPLWKLPNVIISPHISAIHLIMMNERRRFLPKTCAATCSACLCITALTRKRDISQGSPGFP